MIRYHLRAIIVRVTQHGRDLYTGAMGYSMPGVPATPQMHFRNGAMAFTYIGEIYAELADQKKLRLDDKLSMWMPKLPHASEVTIENLLNMTSGYADYVYQPQLETAILRDPFRQWTTDELIDIGVSRPLQFQPGTNWAYSHTNYAILGRLLEIITGRPLAQVMQRYIIGPMGLEKNFYGNGATAGYLPAQDLTIAVSVTYNPQAFDSTGDYANASASVFTAIATALAPNQAPPSS